MVDLGEEEAKPAKKGGFFSKKKEETGLSVSDLLEQINSLGRRLRLLESRYTDLNRKAQVTETNMLNERKRFITEIKTTNSDIIEIKKEIEGVKTKMDRVISELKNFASKDEIDKRRAGIIASIEKQEKMTDELRAKIEATYNLTELEDLYLPYKQKRKTRAVKAKENGLEPLANIIFIL